jgi:hypothetical protein
VVIWSARVRVGVQLCISWTIWTLRSDLEIQLLTTELLSFLHLVIRSVHFYLSGFKRSWSSSATLRVISSSSSEDDNSSKFFLKSIFYILWYLLLHMYGVNYLLSQFRAITFRIVKSRSWGCTCSTVIGGFIFLKKMLHWSQMCKSQIVINSYEVLLIETTHPDLIFFLGTSCNVTLVCLFWVLALFVWLFTVS